MNTTSLSLRSRFRRSWLYTTTKNNPG